jgi:hypothetical protein
MSSDYDATDIGIPKEWATQAKKLQEQRKQEDISHTKNLVKQKADLTKGHISDKEIKDPRLFLKNIKEVEDTLKDINTGGAHRLKAKLTPFINDIIIPNLRKGIKIPGDIQKEFISDAIEADESGKVLDTLTRAFTEKYSPIYEQEQRLKEYKLTGKRALEIVKIIRKIASCLIKYSK